MLEFSDKNTESILLCICNVKKMQVLNIVCVLWNIFVLFTWEFPMNAEKMAFLLVLSFRHSKIQWNHGSDATLQKYWED